MEARVLRPYDLEHSPADPRPRCPTGSRSALVTASSPTSSEPTWKVLTGPGLWAAAGALAAASLADPTCLAEMGRVRVGEGRKEDQPPRSSSEPRWSRAQPQLAAPGTAPENPRGLPRARSHSDPGCAPLGHGGGARGEDFGTWLARGYGAHAPDTPSRVRGRSGTELSCRGLLAECARQVLSGLGNKLPGRVRPPWASATWPPLPLPPLPRDLTAG